MLKSLVLSGAATLLFLLVHAALFRARRIERRFRAMSRIFLGAAALYTAAYWLWPDAETPLLRAFWFLNGLVWYVFVFVGYLEFYFTADRSITVRILREVLASRDGSLSKDEFKGLFPVEDRIFDRRFREMVESGYLSEAGGRYRVTSKGGVVGRMYDAVIRFLNLEGG